MECATEMRCRKRNPRCFAPGVSRCLRLASQVLGFAVRPDPLDSEELEPLDPLDPLELGVLLRTVDVEGLCEERSRGSAPVVPVATPRE